MKRDPDQNQPDRPDRDEGDAPRVRSFTREEFRALRREAEAMLREVQQQVDAFRRDPSRNKFRWL